METENKIINLEPSSQISSAQRQCLIKGGVKLKNLQIGLGDGVAKDTSNPAELAAELFFVGLDEMQFIPGKGDKVYQFKITVPDSYAGKIKEIGLYYRARPEDNRVLIGYWDHVQACSEDEGEQLELQLILPPSNDDERADLDLAALTAPQAAPADFAVDKETVIKWESELTKEYPVESSTSSYISDMVENIALIDGGENSNSLLLLYKNESGKKFYFGVYNFQFGELKFNKPKNIPILNNNDKYKTSSNTIFSMLGENKVTFYIANSKHVLSVLFDHSVSSFPNTLKKLYANETQVSEATTLALMGNADVLIGGGSIYKMENKTETKVENEVKTIVENKIETKPAVRCLIRDESGNCLLSSDKQTGSYQNGSWYYNFSIDSTDQNGGTTIKAHFPAWGTRPAAYKTFHVPAGQVLRAGRHAWSHTTCGHGWINQREDTPPPTTITTPITKTIKVPKTVTVTTQVKKVIGQRNNPIIEVLPDNKTYVIGGLSEDSELAAIELSEVKRSSDNTYYFTTNMANTSKPLLPENHELLTSVNSKDYRSCQVGQNIFIFPMNIFAGEKSNKKGRYYIYDTSKQVVKKSFVPTEIIKSVEAGNMADYNSLQVIYFDGLIYFVLTDSDEDYLKSTFIYADLRKYI
ncbi:hypothetical protein RVIR1_09050 [Candidatus Rickettsiella viridis]|uniref:Uncharacterized protein n=1 Tax=Candidatus Rickettsiella viridis TaxID=676208 RepID=A0A2Z5UWD9_9COXI|nr:hypothetical protein [Candidatus Rickettsiella viridis]BBB15385.1 hypothetical protein RVIR1_09050 [Candidatus Rickettsiella viridis]